MANVMTEIAKWVKDLPFWEQAALQRILAGEELTPEFDKQLLKWLLEDNQLSKKDSPRPELDFSRLVSATAATASQKPKLLGIENATNINALAANQCLRFGSAVTAIFGGNGSGKSGYARILGSACFSRGERAVLPNVFIPGSASKARSALIKLQAAEEETAINYAFAAPLAELQPFYVFDSTCISEHLTGENTLSFSPAGISALTSLVTHTDRVRQNLTGIIEKLSQRPECLSRFVGETSVNRALRGLSATTDSKTLRTLAELSEPELAHFEEIEREIAKLKLQDVPKAVQRLKSEVSEFEALAKNLLSLRVGLSDEVEAAIRTAVADFRLKEEEASKAGADQFKIEGLNETGSAAWGEFIHAAHALALAESKHTHPYPGQGDSCLLCHQPLSEEATTLLRSLWKFLDGEAKQRLEESKQRLMTLKRQVAGLNLAFFSPATAIRRVMNEKAPDLSAQLETSIEAATARQKGLLGLFEGATEVPPLPVFCEDEIATHITACGDASKALESNDWSAKMQSLEAELLELKHRKLLAEVLEPIVKHVADLKSAADANRIMGSSRHITKFYNDQFKALVTDRYIAQFQANLAKLGRPLQVNIVAAGKKGSTVKKMVISFPEGCGSLKATPEQVFSEGEKRAIVLADFLTEVELDDDAAGVIFDDPVTSLDAEWKERIAKLLIDEGKKRQVIIFTHDLHFLYLLRAAAEKETVDLETHWIQRGQEDGTPGYVFLNNGPATENDYRDASKARAFLELAKKAGPEEAQRLLRDGFAALRTTYEVFVIKDCFGEVVRRFEERISIDRLKDALLDKTVVAEIIQKVGLLSRYIEGHSHSDSFATTPMTPKLLLDEIESFDRLRAKNKALKKQTAV